jgi:hypothetical protein
MPRTAIMGTNYATTNTVLPPGSTPQQHLNVAMQALGQFGITQGFIGVDLSTPTYSRAVTLVGMARDILSNIANFKQATVSYQQEQVTMVQNGQSMPWRRDRAQLEHWPHRNSDADDPRDFSALSHQPVDQSALSSDDQPV